MSLQSHSNDPSKVEVESRIFALQAWLRQRGLDYYLCHDPANIFYLTNFANYVHERPFLLLVPASGTPKFIMPKLEAGHVKCRAVVELELAHYFEFPAPAGESWSDRLSDYVTERHRVGIEGQCPNVVSQALRAEVLIDDLVDELRAIKSEYEIQRIQYCSDLLSQGHQMLLEMAAPEKMPIMMHKEISGQLMQTLLLDNPKANLINSKFNAITQPGSLSDDPHNFSDVFCTLSEGGPNVTIVQGLANGYGAELERTFFINKVPESAKKPFSDMLDARELAYQLAKPGMSMAEVDLKVNELLRERGYGDNLLHRTGHSFGVTDHEAPFLAEGYEHEIQPNMIFSIEPGIYIPGIGGFRFSDTVLITSDGNKKMTSAPETLGELTIKAISAHA